MLPLNLQGFKNLRFRFKNPSPINIAVSTVNIVVEYNPWIALLEYRGTIRQISETGRGFRV